MNKDITDRSLLEQFNAGIPVIGVWRREITRADGSVEVLERKNTLTSAGLNQLALLGITNTNSAFLYLVVGSQTAAGSLGSVQGGLGEVSRKIGATQTSSKEFMILVATWAGATDSITSVALDSGAAFNHASSGSGVMLNQVNGMGATLGNSDFLKVQMEIRVGSHNL